jgi:hypothetical protein
MIAVCRLRYCPKTRAYADRRTTEGKTKKESSDASSAISPARFTPVFATTSGCCLPPLDIYRNVLAWLR